jgi:hypothetical protein
VPKTNVRCLFKDGINVRKCSNLVDYRTASILRWERNNGYLSPPSMLMAAAKFQWEDPAAGWLGGCQSKSGRDQADLSGSRNTGKIVVKYAMGLCKISTVPFFPSGEPSMSNDVPRMPDPVENNSFISTLDRQGAIWLYIDEITQAYLDFAGQTKGSLLEVAAGYGHIVIKALEAGAERAVCQ